MRLLYHLWLSPFSRKVRIALAEKGLETELEVEPVWERRKAFLALNPTGLVPVMVEENGTVIAESSAICEYIDETHPEPPLIGRLPAERAEVRRLVNWFDLKFHREVGRPLINEKVMKRFMRLGGEPNTKAIRAGYHNIGQHLDYVGYLADRRRWLAGDEFSLADIAAAAHISCVDYLDGISWEKFGPAKDWYARLKSRPSVRPILSDRVPGLNPPKHYDDLDF